MTLGTIVAVVALLSISMIVISVKGSGLPRFGLTRSAHPGSERDAKTPRAFHVAPDGMVDAAGTEQSPLDLGTALSSRSPARPGDTIWLRAGCYRGTFISVLVGTSAAPIVVRQYPGERATIDSAPSIEAALTVRGAWTIYQDFEVTNSNPVRVSSQTGSRATDINRGTGVDVHGPHTSIVNLVVHDLAQGFGIWSDAEGAATYGNIVYSNGWTAPDRNHGHGIYTQNREPGRRISDNVIFNQFGIGIHLYGTSAASLDYVTIEGNTIFNNGLLESESFDRNILVGGGRFARHPILKSNNTYYTPGLRTGGNANTLGYAGGCTDLVLEDNYFAHSNGYPVTLSNCSGRIRNNLFYGYTDDAVRNQYPDNTYLVTRPRGTRVALRRNEYEEGRAHITIYNWDRYRTVAVDLGAAGLKDGMSYVIRDAQDYFGAPVQAGFYEGLPTMIPMDSLAVSQPIGTVSPPHTPREFGVFVVVPTGHREDTFGRVRAFFKRVLYRL